MICSVMKKGKNIMLDEEVIEKLEKMAEKENRSFSYMVNQILREKLIQEKKEGKK